MGVSTDGILFWGVCMEEGWPDCDEVEGLDDICTEWMAKKLGWVDTWVDTDGPKPDGHEWASSYLERIGCAVEMDMHCSCKYPMYFFYVKDRRFRAARGYPEEIDPAKLEVSDEEKSAFKLWMDRLGIEHEEPKWWLCSLWG